MNEKKLENVLALNAEDRYGYLIRKTADFEIIFLIADLRGNYVTIGIENNICIPVWPEKKFAELMVETKWPDHIIKEMDIYEFIDWQDSLMTENYLIAGFPNRQLNSVVVSPTEIKSHLIYECNQLE